MKVLLVGYGYWGKKVFATLQQFKDLEVLVYDKATHEESLDEFLKKTDDFDYVFIITPEETHYELVKKFLILGKNVFVEKPLCLESEQAEELVSLAKDKVLFVDYIFLYDNFSKKIKEILNSSVLGKIKKVSISRFSSFVNKPNLLISDDLLIHDLYLLRYWFEIGIDENSLSLLSKEGLKELSFSFSLKNKKEISLIYSYLRPDTEREIVFFGEKGKLIWKKDKAGEKIVLSKTGKEELIEVTNQESPLYKSINDFMKKKNNNQSYNDYLNDVNFLSLLRKKIL